jgi:hypothetical protein
MCVLGLPRSTIYYRPIPVRESTLRILARIDALYSEDPCSGSRRMVDYLARDGIPICRDRARNLMQRMGLRAINQKPRITLPGDLSPRLPCLVDLSPGTCSAGSFLTALTRNSASIRWRSFWKADASLTFSTPIKGVSSPRPTLLPGFWQRRLRSAGQEERVATTLSWWRGCGERARTRGSVSVATAVQ